jgi:glycerol-3-phosphate cytidylyltransferase-like family protein
VGSTRSKLSSPIADAFVVGDAEPKPRATVIGVFDGVHRGHQLLLETARRTGLTPTVITFAPHPRVAFGGYVRFLTTLERRLELLQTHGAVDIVVLAFDQNMASMGPGAWADAVLKRLGTEHVVIGENFRFGKDRAGDATTLSRKGMAVTELPLLNDVSSSRIRDLVASGDVQEAAARLGRPFSLPTRLFSTCVGYDGVQLLVRPAVGELALPASGSYAATALDRPATLDVAQYGSAGALLRLWLRDTGVVERLQDRSVEVTLDAPTRVNQPLARAVGSSKSHGHDRVAASA